MDINDNADIAKKMEQVLASNGPVADSRIGGFPGVTSSPDAFAISGVKVIFASTWAAFSLASPPEASPRPHQRRRPIRTLRTPPHANDFFM